MTQNQCWYFDLVDKSVLTHSISDFRSGGWCSNNSSKYGQANSSYCTSHCKLYKLSWTLSNDTQNIKVLIDKGYQNIHWFYFLGWRVYSYWRPRQVAVSNGIILWFFQWWPGTRGSHLFCSLCWCIWNRYILLNNGLYIIIQYDFSSWIKNIFCYVFPISGLVTAACLPTYTGGLTGVVCVDIPISDLLSDVTYFHQGELSYAFIVDGTGRTLIHPLLPTPFGLTQDPIFVHISSLERDAQISTVLESMERWVDIVMTY